MSENIIPQLLTVSFYGNPAGRGKLKYSPGPLDEVARDILFHPVRWNSVKDSLDSVRQQVADLIRRARMGQTVGKAGPRCRHAVRLLPGVYGNRQARIGVNWSFMTFKVHTPLTLPGFSPAAPRRSTSGRSV